MAKHAKRIIDGRDLSLEDWLESISHPPPQSWVLDYAFPTEEHKGEYLATIAQRSEREVKALLRKFLFPSCSFGLDRICFDALQSEMRSGRKAEELTEFQQRLLSWGFGARGVFPWEGITWVLDLCPWRPKEALAALSAYLLAHIQFLPDGRIDGLSDALEIIRARYIGNPETNREKVCLLLDLPPRQFECLVERTYKALGYRTRLTPPQKDGGRDILAEHSKPSRREELRIECKRYGGRFR
jgi:restriction system protein